MDAAERSIDNQQKALATQAAGTKLYKRVVTVIGVVIAVLVALVLKLIYQYL